MRFLNSFIDKISYLIFILNGKKPWSFGYNEYKWKMIEKYLDFNLFNEENFLKNFGFRIDDRIIEYPWFFSRLPKQQGILLDAGSILNYERIISHPLLLNKKIHILTLAPEHHCFWQKGISYVFEDLRNSCYKENYFDWIVCLSTMEHVGFDNTMLYTNDFSKKEYNPLSYLSAVKELHRILKPGGTLYLTVPFGKNKNYGWFQVFDEKMIDDVIKKFFPSSYTETYFRYLPDGWEKSTRLLSKNATFFDIHTQKNYDSDFAAGSRAVVCLEMVK